MPSNGTSSSVHRGMEREPREDRHLGGGVLAVHVLGRVGLGVAELLRARERVGVGRAGARHLGEDVVGGAVHDAVHLLDVRARERLAHHADHRHHAGHRRLVAKLRAARRARPRTARRRAGRAAACSRSRAACRPRARAARTRAPARCRRSARRSRPRTSRISSNDPRERVSTPRQLGPAAGGRRDRVRALGEQRVERRPHRAVTEQADAERRGRHASRAARSS